MLRVSDALSASAACATSASAAEGAAAGLMTDDTRIGNIDESGYLNGMTRRGYTPPKCILELYANSIDAVEKQRSPHIRTKKIIAKVERTVIKLLDNGVGMDRAAAGYMFSMHRQNHAGDHSMGVSGIGAKPATLILSEETPVHIFTRQCGGEYLHITVPWDEIMRIGKFTGMVICAPMTDEEKANFIQDRTENEMLAGPDGAVGTTIQFLNSDFLQELLHNNFLPIEESDLNPLDRISIIFGRMGGIEFWYQCQSTNIPAPKYNYFGGHFTDYYGGIRRDRIEHYYSTKDKKERFIWMKDTQQMEISQSGKGFSKEPSLVKTNLKGYTQVGEYEVKTGCRIDPAIFDPEAPAPLVCNGKYNAYVQEHLGVSPEKEFLHGTGLVRNGQLLGNIPLADFQMTSARGSSESWFDNVLVQQDMEYNPVSNQDNQQDKAMGVQENKNQLDGKAISPKITRLLKAIRMETAREIRKDFEEQIQAVSYIPSESDTDCDEESDDVESYTEHVYEALVPAVRVKANILEKFSDIEVMAGLQNAPAVSETTSVAQVESPVAHPAAPEETPVEITVDLPEPHVAHVDAPTEVHAAPAAVHEPVPTLSLQIAGTTTNNMLQLKEGDRILVSVNGFGAAAGLRDFVQAFNKATGKSFVDIMRHLSNM